MRRVVSVLALAAAIPVASRALSAQAPGPQPIPVPMPLQQAPEISVTADGEAKLTPDRARISIGVTNRAATAAAAGAENARRQRAVIDAVRALGVAAEQISTHDYNVYPEQRFDQPSQTSKVIGYNVTNTVQVEVRNISQVGTLIDAVLGKGANQINALEFYASNTDDARRIATAQAITKARADADAAAKAAGGTLGPLLSVVVSPNVSGPIPRPMMARAVSAEAAQSTPVSEGQQTVSAIVFARWRFNPGR